MSIDLIYNKILEQSIAAVNSTSVLVYNILGCYLLLYVIGYLAKMIARPVTDFLVLISPTQYTSTYP